MVTRVPLQSNPQSAGQAADKRETGCISSLSRIRHSRPGRIVFTALAVVVVIITGYYVVNKLILGIQQVAVTRLHIEILPIILSLLITFFCVIFGGIAWTLILYSLGIRTGFRDSMRSNLLANLASYIPGYGWQYLGKAYLTTRQNISPVLAASAVLVELLCSVMTRIAISLTFLSPQLWYQATRFESDTGLWILRLIAWLGVLMLPWILNYTQRSRLGTLLKIGQPVQVPLLWLVELMMCLGWVIYGLSFAILLRSMTNMPIDTLSPVIFATTSSYLVSLFIFFVPAGIGVREGVLIYTLTGVLPQAAVSLGSVLSRLVVIVAELSGALLGYCLGRFWPGKRSH
ncbi:MAG: lysylphosphatidylglycerol synthase domain-containing protein [Anaerolineae bacterium]